MCFVTSRGDYASNAFRDLSDDEFFDLPVFFTCPNRARDWNGYKGKNFQGWLEEYGCEKTKCCTDSS